MAEAELNLLTGATDGWPGAPRQWEFMLGCRGVMCERDSGAQSFDGFLYRCCLCVWPLAEAKDPRVPTSGPREDTWATSRKVRARTKTKISMEQLWFGL